MTRVDIIDSVSVRTRNNSQLRTMNELATEQTYFELYNQSTWYFSGPLAISNGTPFI